ncbi:hypothetical protein [Streptomyces xanthochromogenes]|uniref:hypothetical protein n=1 Tax=Streptomyces xanthochromogenes TaxID=67384 RepID=UPI003801F2FB
MASDQSPPIPDEQDSTSPDDKARLTLLRAVALSRPLDEVASLAHLLNQTGEQPRPGDEALHLAAVSRPLDEVRQLISLLKKPPHTDDEADTALRAVAAERSIEDVAALIADCHPHANAPRDEPAPSQETALVPFGPEALAPPVPDTAPAVSEAPVPAPMPMTAAAVMPPSAAPVNGDQGDGGPAFVGPVDNAPAVDNATAHSTSAHGPVESGPAESGTAKSGPAESGPVENGPVENGPAAPETGAATPGTAASRAPALRSVLRWPAAAALLLIGVLHLPNDIMAVHTGNRTAAASMVIAAICLTLAVLLPLYDTVWAWALGAGAAVATAAVHSVGAGFKSVHLLRNSLGSTFAGATTLAVLCAVVAAVLAATVLLRKPAQQRAADKA